jgi:hypothetical protein
MSFVAASFREGEADTPSDEFLHQLESYAVCNLGKAACSEENSHGRRVHPASARVPVT